MENELKKRISPTEKILWEGKPNKKCFIRKKMVNDILIGAIICAVVVGFMIYGLIKGGYNLGGVITTLAFSTFIWIYFGRIISAIMRLKRIYYIITDKGIYSSDGALFEKFNFISFYEITDLRINLNRPDIADIWIGIQVPIPTPENPVVVRPPDIAPGIQFEIACIPEYKQVYEIINQQCMVARNARANSGGDSSYKTMSETTGRNID